MIRGEDACAAGGFCLEAMPVRLACGMIDRVTPDQSGTTQPSAPIEVDTKSPPFDQFKHLRWLGVERSGRDSMTHVRHHLYVGRDKRSPVDLLIKLSAKPGLVYQQNLTNEIASLTTINTELPSSPYFPFVREHGTLPDGRVYLISTLFDEFPLASAISAEVVPAKTVSHLRTAIEISRALSALHELQIFHVDLNPMNILYRAEKGAPIIRIVDFESSYEATRHSTGTFYSPPTTPGFSAPEAVAHQTPDARADLYSLGAVLYTMLAGYGWTWEKAIGTCIDANSEIDVTLKSILVSAVNVDPKKRYRSVEQFRTDLAAYLERIWPGRTW